MRGQARNAVPQPTAPVTLPGLDRRAGYIAARAL